MTEASLECQRDLLFGDLPTAASATRRHAPNGDSVARLARAFPLSQCLPEAGYDGVRSDRLNGFVLPK